MFSANGSPFKRGKVSRRRLEVSYLEFGLKSKPSSVIGCMILSLLLGEIFTVGDTWDKNRSVIINRSGQSFNFVKTFGWELWALLLTPLILMSKIKIALYRRKNILNYNPLPMRTWKIPTTSSDSVSRAHNSAVRIRSS